MNPILRNVLAVLAGIIVGSIVNMGIIIIGSKIFPVEGLDLKDMETFAAAAEAGKFTTIHYIYPILAHALGTLVGAFVAVKLGVNRHIILAFIVGVFFLIGGYMNLQTIPHPAWFGPVDLLLAYLPMAWLGAMFGFKKA